MLSNSYTNNFTNSNIKNLSIELLLDPSGVTPILHVIKSNLTKDTYKGIKIVGFLNEATGKVDNSTRTISVELEENLYKNLSDYIEYFNGFYSFKSKYGIDFGRGHEKAFEQKEIFNKSLTAPNIIRKIDSSTVIDEDGNKHKMGLLSSFVRFDYARMKLSSDNIALLQTSIVNNAIKFTKLKHLIYSRDYKGEVPLNISLPKPFFNELECGIFQSKSTVKPSDAINSILSHRAEPMAIECAMAMQIIMYKGLLDFMGPEKFNCAFSEGLRIELKVTNLNPLYKNYLKRWGKFTSVVEGSAEDFIEKHIRPGDLGYVRNVDFYKSRHPKGAAQGHNVIYLGKDKNNNHMFSGFFTVKKLRNYVELVDLLINNYNIKPIHCGIEQSKVSNQKLRIKKKFNRV